MTIHFGVHEPSGRATCRICGELIKKGSQVTAYGYRDQGSVHLHCLIAVSKGNKPRRDKNGREEG